MGELIQFPDKQKGQVLPFRRPMTKLDPELMKRQDLTVAEIIDLSRKPRKPKPEKK